MNSVKLILLISVLIGFSTSHTSVHNPFYIFGSAEHDTDSNHTTKTYLVETKLSQNELEDLLADAKKNPEKVDDAVKEHKKAKKNKKPKMDPFERAIEKEIEEDSLHPLDDFQVTEITEPKQENLNATVLITKTKGNLFDKLYEKNFSKKFGFMLLLLVIISIFVFHNLYTKNCGKKFSKEGFYYKNTDYMLKNY